MALILPSVGSLFIASISVLKSSPLLRPAVFSFTSSASALAQWCIFMKLLYQPCQMIATSGLS